ncbi:MAG: efflux RND transporter permease subunit, partial [Mariniphaga sp.]
ALQMNEGNNIVWFGKDVNQTIANVARQLPANVKMTTIVNQPKMVDDNISRFMHEFLIAIISVIIVILLMLPFRVAAVAATAIPMTIAITFALMRTFGIELHQVSLAALIVVLGMVVDDAIVVADNYVELLDKGMERWTAAWHSAFDLIVPILTATITIIASFMPMIILSGAMGEFIQDLPLTVTIALLSSFIVAMFLTPTLCFFFIKKGLHDHSAVTSTTKKRTSVLDYMQIGYDKTIDWCTKHSAITINGSLLTIVAALFLFNFGVRQRFMPFAERNQFVVELWMPTGTKLDKTQQAILRVENMVKKDKRVVSFATFAGMSAPRVYYNFSPEIPITNYAQILINTDSNRSTETLAGELSAKIDSLIPEGMPQVKLMQQGMPMPAPVEVRIYGDDISKMKEIGNQVKVIIKKTNGNYLVRDDFKEDFYGIDIQLKEDASRLGFTTTSISQFVFTGFKGYPVSKMYEGDKVVDIVLRLDNKGRQTAQDIENMYIESPVTGANVPLRQIAEIKPTWQTGRIMHRNGMRCLTVRSETMGEVLPAELLAEIRPKIANLDIPSGYKIEYGGEIANQQEVMSQLIVALVISLVLIFLILLFQFRNLKETGIVMLTIPLSLFGAVLGLVVTGNNFGFTAFIGLISLAGIVVRNAIILIDYINELLEKGLDIRTAAIEAGKRRMRPIFLTAMAAAMGVLPMIISGSSLWSPLASVLAFGITWSMLMALLTVPVLYIVSIKPSDLKMKEKQTKSNENRPADNIKPGSTVNVNVAKVLAVLTVLVLIAPNLTAQQTIGKLDLKQATEMALTNNHFLKIKQMQVNEKQQKVNEDKVKFFPMVSVEGNDLVNQNIPELTISQGSFGALPMGNIAVPLPDADKVFEMGAKNIYNASAMVYQPVSQLLKINAGVQISKTDLAITKTEQAKVTMQIKQAVEKLYYGLLIVQKQKEECEIKLTLVKAKLYDVEGAVISGKATESAKIGLNASVANQEQDLLKLNIQYDDYAADLKNLIGLPQSAMLELSQISDDSLVVETLPMATIPTVQSGNTDLKIAMLVKSKAEFALKASKLSYFPDLGIMGGYNFQKGNYLYPKNNTFFGVSMKWNIQDMASNTFVKRQRVFMQQQAEENIANIKEQVNTDVSKAYRKLSQSAELIIVARKVVNFRREDMKIQADKQATGLNIKTEYLTTKADLSKSEADLFAAQLGYKLAFTELQILMGNF